MTYNALNGISIEQLKDEISRIYTEADQLFGNIDYSDLNYATAKLLERYTKEFNRRKGGTGEDITNYDYWLSSYTRPWESEDGTWTGSINERGFGDIRVVYTKLTKTVTEPASAATRVYYPYAFKDVDPLVFYVPIMTPQPLTDDFVQNRRTGDIYRGIELLVDADNSREYFLLKEHIRGAATTTPQGGTLPVYTTDQIQKWERSIGVMAVGIGDYPFHSYRRPDYVDHR